MFRRVFKIAPGLWHAWIDDQHQTYIAKIETSFLNLPDSSTYIGFWEIKPTVTDVESALKVVAYAIASTRGQQ